MAELPTGTVTFLFTDIEGSTRLWEERPEAMREALARHDAILEEAIALRRALADQLDATLARIKAFRSQIQAEAERCRQLLDELG